MKFIVDILQEDIDKWVELARSGRDTAFIHNALNGVTVVGAEFSAQIEFSRVTKLV